MIQETPKALVRGSPGTSANLGERDQVGLDMWARYGRSPLWLTFGRSGLEAARRSFPGQVVETIDNWIAVPIDLPVGEPEDRVVDALEDRLTDAGERLYAALGGQSPPDDGKPDDGDPDDGDPEDDAT